MSLLAKVRAYKYRLLLFSLGSLSAISPLTAHFSSAKIIYLVLLQFALLACLLAVSEKRRRLIFSLVLGGVTFVVVSREYLDSESSVRLSALILLIASFGFLATLFLIEILRAREITIEQISGAICVYLLIGIVWSFLFRIALNEDPSAIHFPAATAQEDGSSLMYFSYVTLTTLGYGDVHPLTPPVRTLCWLEAIIGQFYMTVLIARLVGINLSQSVRHDDG